MKPARTSLALLALSTSLLAWPASATPALKGDAARAAFADLQALVGSWDADIDEDGKPDSVVSYRLTGGGTVLVETLFEGGDHEMVTMYHMNGEELWLTHYCAAGNQPRMRLVRSPEGTPLTFEVVDVTNLASRNDMHMGRVEVSLEDGDKVRSTWTSFQDRKPGQVVTFTMARKQ